MRVLDLSQTDQELGPFVLVQRPPSPVYHQLAKLLGRGETVGMAHANRLGEEILAMAREFESSLVIPLVALAHSRELLIGRAQECDVVVHEPSVSSRHAKLSFDVQTGRCSVKDLGSRNGTFVNARRLFTREAVLDDGDALSFGDAQFLLMRPMTVREQMASLRGRSA